MLQPEQSRRTPANSAAASSRLACRSEPDELASRLRQASYRSARTQAPVSLRIVRTRAARTMRILFAHRHFPGHFAHLARALAADPGNQVVFVHAAGQGEIEGVRRLRIRPAREPWSTTHHYLQPLERAVLMGQAAYRAAACLSEGGFEPDLVYFHAGFGMGLYLKEAFPAAPSLGLFEWYYRAYGSDADYLGPL